MQQIFSRFTACIFLYCLISGFLSCKKSNPREEAPAPTPAITGKGIPKEPGTQRVIGPAGGTLASADGKLSIVVPAGSVATDMTFGIQPITNTLLGDTAKRAFRLTPEGTTFTKPVEVVYHYGGNTEGMMPELLIAGYQTAEGAWKAVPAKVNKDLQQFSFKTTHFSDWSITGAIELVASKKHVQVGDQVQLEITGVAMVEDDLLAPLTKLEIDGWLKDFDWRLLNNFGAIDYDGKDPSKATYTPDHPAPGGDNKAEISVTCNGQIKVMDENAPGGYHTIKQLTLLTSVEILGEVFMAGDFGASFNMTQVTALMANGRIYINGHSEGISVAFEAFGFQADGYPSGERGTIGKSFTSAIRTTGTEVFSYGSEYQECGPPSVPRYSSGVLNIKSWGKIGEPVEGSFSGTLYMADGRQNGCVVYKQRALNVTFKTVRSL